MSFTFFERKNFEKYKTIICIFSISVFSTYFLIEILIFSVNFPRADDWPSIFAAIYFQQNNPLWVDSILGAGNEHLLFVYRILMMSVFQINSYNIFHINILNWGLLVSSIVLFYQILKKTDSRLTWLIIPISAFVLNPKIFFGSIVASIGLVWNLTFFFSILTISIFAKEKISNGWFSLAIVIAALASFSSVLGLLTWIVGIIFLLKNIKQNKNYLVVWIAVFLIISLFFYALSEPNSGRKDIFSILTLDGLLYFLEYVANPFTLAPDVLKHVFGFLIIFSILSISIFLLIKKVKKTLPWILLSLLGLLFALFTTIGRFDVRPPDMSYFIIMSTVIDIGLLGLFSILFLERKNFRKKSLRQITSIIFVTFIVIQMGVLGATYVYYLDKIHEGSSTEDIKEKLYSCFHLLSNYNECPNFHVFGDPSRHFNDDPNLPHSDIFTLINFFIANKMAIFSNDDFFKQLEEKKSLLINDVDKTTKKIYVSGDIQTMNDNLIFDQQEIYLQENFISIAGWIQTENENPEKIILFIDNIPFLSTTIFISPDIQNLENVDNPPSFWSISLFPAYVGDGCHLITVGGIYETILFSIEKQFTLCIDSSEIYTPGELISTRSDDMLNKLLTKFGFN